MQLPGSESRDYQLDYLQRTPRLMTERAEAKVDEHQHAIAELARLVKIPGTLQVITHLLDANGMPVVHDVTRIDGPTAKGMYVARTREGDSCRGYAPALLARLTEAHRIGPLYRKAVREGVLAKESHDQRHAERQEQRKRVNGTLNAAPMTASGNAG